MYYIRMEQLEDNYNPIVGEYKRQLQMDDQITLTEYYKPITKIMKIMRKTLTGTMT